jgi:AcrR family transcriptional regulator
MSLMTEFIRARQDDQKNARRLSLLTAAAALFDEMGPSGAGLNAIAARAGFTKSNVYRYFENREDVLLALFLDEFERYCEDAGARLLACRSGDLGGLAAAWADALVTAPRLCELVAIFGSVLERNVSASRIEAVKIAMADQTSGLVAALRERVPGSSAGDCGWVFSMTMALLAGMWPGVRPSPALATVLAKPQFAHMVLHVDRELRRTIEAMLRSIVAPPGR